MYSEKLIDITDLLNLSIAKGASDIHMAANNPLFFRISGKLIPVEGVDRLSPKQAEHILYNMMNEEQIKTFQKVKDFDFAYEHTSGDTFRVNAFYKRKNIVNHHPGY